MPSAVEVVDQAIKSTGNLRRQLRKGTNRQVQSGPERSLVKATALAWFKTRAVLQGYESEALDTIDANFRELLAAGDRSTNRSKYDEDLRELRDRLINLRSYLLEHPPRSDTRAEVPPDFMPLVPAPAMREIINSRWRETQLCIEAGAYLAATVMMGGLLEGLLLARVNVLADKSAVFKAKGAHRDKAGKTLALSEWTLKHFIDVAHELGWIRPSAKDVGAVLRDYRNYIHPEKQLSHGVTIEEADARMFWAVFKSIAGQVVASVQPAT